MPPTDPFVTRLMTMLTPLGPIETRFMFGGTGLYLDGHHFAIAYGGRVYFRVDAATTAAFKEGGGQPFRYRRDGKPVTVVGYQEPPADSLKDGKSLLPWAQRGIEAARRISVTKPEKLQ